MKSTTKVVMPRDRRPRGLRRMTKRVEEMRIRVEEKAHVEEDCILWIRPGRIRGADCMVVTDEIPTA